MTVRLTPTESDSTQASQVAAPPQSSGGTVTTPGTDDGAPGTDTRIGLREARRQRRRTAWMCAAVVAVCLGLTIVVVSLARTRPAPAPGAVISSAPAPLVQTTAAPGSTSLPGEPRSGAPAPEGGTR